MPANMMIDPPGSSLNVIGRRSATVRAGPMPGRTPTAVPSSTPMRAKSRFIGWIATVSPCARDAKASMGSASDQMLERSRRKGQSKELGEQEVDHDAEHEPDQEILEE